MSDSSGEITIDGSCHCGNVRFVFTLPDPGGLIPARTCGCSFCRKHGAAHTSHPDGRLHIQLADADAVNRYRFGTGTADFLVCTRCGVEPAVTSEIDGRLYAVVNVNCFEGIGHDQLDFGSADFDGEGTDDRLARRQRNWIGNVTIA